MPAESPSEVAARVAPAIAGLRVDRVTAGVVAAFDEAGVPSILLKGPSIAATLYRDGAGRPYADADLLVPPDRHPQAAQILANLGFENVLAEEETPGWKLTAELWIRPDGPQVDLHRTLTGIGVAAAAAWEALSARSRPMRVGGVTVQVLSGPALAFNVALHACQHGRKDERRLKDLTRAVEAIGADEWREAAELARCLEAVPAFAIGLRLVPAGSRLAAELGLPAAASRAASLRASNPPRGALGLEELAQAGGSKAKLDLIVSNFVPSPEFLRAWSPLARRGRLGLAAAYVWRPIAILLRAVPASLAWLHASRQSSS